jgi:3'(2'), 5'-bisphosphate nucleotidase
MSFVLCQENLQQLISLCQEAGQAIMAIYQRSEGFNIDAKADNSPLTEADLAAHKLLEQGLTALTPDIPVLSEESESPDFATRQSWSRYWIVDPLDGTKEFIKRSGEFTVNVALIEKGVAVMGVVHVPALSITYGAINQPTSEEHGAWKQEAETRTAIKVRDLPTDTAVAVVASRNHGAEEVVALLDRVGATLGPAETKSMGSSLKLCLVAEGKADLYPRLAPTCEWDTAAAQAVVEAAGGQVLDDQLAPLRYNQKDSLLNPHFYVIGDTHYDWQHILKS